MMKQLFFLISLICSCLLANSAGASNSPLAFSLHKLGDENAGNTILVVGGIQGDEPGGFHAASLLTTHYTISGGSVWIVPNLNFPSIVSRSRGANGDLNRKFAAIANADPDLEVIERIKSIITHQQVDLILNLHDGSGFYREKYTDDMHGPHRWGQSLIIDQEEIESPKFTQIGEIGRNIIDKVNSNLPEMEQHYLLKNTKTRDGDEEMAKSLTYFAINHQKAAFGIEASKSLNKAQRVFCHLNVLEAFMEHAGIKFTRKFPLELAGVEKALSDNRQIAFYDNRIYLEMENIRNQIKYFPVYASKNIDFATKNPLITVVSSADQLNVFHGNEKITTLHPQFFEPDDEATPPEMELLVDGSTTKVAMGQTVAVKSTFTVMPRSGYRVNIIGYSKKGAENESGISIKKKDCISSYSLNNSGSTFRIEFYKESKKTAKINGKAAEKFAGMVTVTFLTGPADKLSKATVAAAAAPAINREVQFSAQKQ